MSRTTAHRPPWTRHTDAAVWVEVHDHRNGPCDLIPLHQWAAPPSDMWGGLRRNLRCGWALDLHAIPPTCGCALCTNQHERRAERRAQRRAVKLELRRGDWCDDIA